MTEILEATREATTQSNALLEQVALAARRTQESRREAQLAGVVRRRAKLRVYSARMNQALAGIRALTAFRKSAQAQELFSLRESIVLFDKKVAFADSSLHLTADYLCFVDIHYGIQWGHNESIVGRSGEDQFLSTRLRFGTIDDQLISSRKLERFLGRHPLDLFPQHVDEDWDDYLSRQREVDDAFATDVMFQILVDCGDPAKFENYILSALK